MKKMKKRLKVKIKKELERARVKREREGGGLENFHGKWFGFSFREFTKLTKYRQNGSWRFLCM